MSDLSKKSTPIRKRARVEAKELSGTAKNLGSKAKDALAPRPGALPIGFTAKTLKAKVDAAGEKFKDAVEHMKG